MNKFLLSLVAATFLLAAFSGCAKKAGDGNEGENASATTLDETLNYDSAVADNGFIVAGGAAGTATALTTGTDGSATSVKGVDISPDDATGATDLADFLLDAKEADGGRVQAELRSLTTASDANVSGDFLGGVAHNVDVFGDSGVGPADLPKTKAYLLVQGLARVKADGETVEDLQVVQVAVIKGIRGADGALLPEAEDDLEIHVLFPAFAGSEEGSLYYYFENVRLELLAPEDKATVGSRLAAAPKANTPPVAQAAVLLNGTPITAADFDPDSKWLNVTFDASNSTDADGKIEAYSWDVKEYNGNGTLIPLNKTSGQVANFSFTSGGIKVISLRIIDEDGGIANTTFNFYVNTKKVYEHAFTSTAAVGGGYGMGVDCTEAFNCAKHSVTVFWGAQQLLTTEFDGGSTCMGSSMALMAPSGAEAASGSEIAATAEQLTEVGKYQILVGFEAQVNCSYSFVTQVIYAPAAEAPAEEDA